MSTHFLIDQVVFHDEHSDISIAKSLRHLIEQLALGLDGNSVLTAIAAQAMGPMRIEDWDKFAGLQRFENEQKLPVAC